MTSTERSTATDEFRVWLEQLRPDVDAELDRLLPPADEVPERLHEAMRYAVFAGGKRVRPALVLLAGELYGAPRERLLPAAAALEMIHTFSLVHDDLPALDDDDLRRGRATVHKQYDEALAVLVGDALLNLGLGVVASRPAEVDGATRATATAWLAEAVGTRGMIGGQVADLEAEHRWPEDAAGVLEQIHRRKTGALLVVSLRLGGLYAGVDAEADRRLRRLGEAIGLLFQIADDILDVEGDTATLGKTAGKDEAVDKLTYPRVFGLDESKHRLARVRDEALDLAAGMPCGGGVLPALVTYRAERDR